MNKSSKEELLKALPGRTLVNKGEALGVSGPALSQWRSSKPGAVEALLLRCYEALSVDERERFLKGGIE